GLVPVVEDVVLAQGAQQLGIEGESGLEVLVVVLGDLEELEAAAQCRGRGGEDVLTGDRHVLGIGVAGRVRAALGDLGGLGGEDVEEDLKGTIGFRHYLDADEYRWAWYVLWRLCFERKERGVGGFRMVVVMGGRGQDGVVEARRLLDAGGT